MTAGAVQPQDDAVDVRDNPVAHRYEVWVGDELAGHTKYRQVEGSTYAFDHTEVDEQFEGRGLAGRLVQEALDDARRRGWAILPFCEYVQSWLARNPAYVDLVPAAERERFGLD
jgi:hypothetical protein